VKSLGDSQLLQKALLDFPAAFLSFEFCTTDRTLRGKFALFEHHFCSAEEAKTSVAFGTVPVSALNALAAYATGSVKHASML
jgi:hypothetical protein